MQRRTFLTSSLAAAALGAASRNSGGSALAARALRRKGRARLFYELRRYSLSNGPQRKLCNDFFSGALVPALNRLGITPVGVFDVAIGPLTPSIYVLLPSASRGNAGHRGSTACAGRGISEGRRSVLECPCDAARIRADGELVYSRRSRKSRASLCRKRPQATAQRVFELRTYESPSDQDHKRKVEMMQSGEEAIFNKAGFTQVFYGDALIGGTAAESDVHAELREHGRAGQTVEGVCDIAGVESDDRRPALFIRRNCLEHHQHDSYADGILADLVPELRVDHQR